MTAFKVMEDIAEARFRWIQNVRDKFLACRDVEMARDYEIPIEDWEALRDALMQPFDHRVKIDGIKAISAGSSNGIIYKLAEMAAKLENAKDAVNRVCNYNTIRDNDLAYCAFIGHCNPAAIAQAEAEYKALATRVETLERDAIRYRYLRKNPTMLLHLKNSEFDSAIDAALAHSQEVGNG